MSETDSNHSLLTLNAKYIAISHSFCSVAAFLAAFIIGYSLHFEKIVRNEYYGYPEEWFPSVSATIGDRYPERSVFQILIALTAGPRFLLLFINYINLFKKNSKLPNISLFTGLVRTVTCGGWVYITSTDDHDWHDIFMILYIILTLPWNITVIKLSDPNSSIKKYRKLFSYLFFGTLFPLIYLFIQHKVHHTPGSYSYYAYCEWGLIVLDIAFDACCVKDFENLIIEIKPSSDADTMFSLNLSTADVDDISAYGDETYETKSKEKLIDSTILIPKSIQLISSSYSLILINIVNSYMFWSIFTSLFLCLWYFPLWFMGISGYELVILTCLSPIFLKINRFKQFAMKQPHILRVLTCLFGIGSYFIDDPIFRLLSISLGNSLGFICLSIELMILGNLKRNESNSSAYYANIHSYSVTFMLGLTLSSISKFAYWTNNPVWPILNEKTGGLNKIGLVVGLLSAYCTKFPKITKEKDQDEDARKEVLFDFKDWLYTIFGFGALIFSALAMLTDSSTIILWTWSGYPINGPIPVPHGAITLTVMSLGIYSNFFNQLKLLKLVTILGVIGSAVLYSFDGWLGFIGGMFYVYWLAYISPFYFEKMSSHYRYISSTMFFSSLIMILLILMHVWVVAYAFVPGGPLLRERTDIVLGTSVVLLLFGVFHKKRSENNFEEAKVRWHLNKFLNVIISFMLLSYLIAFNRFQYTEPKPYHPESRLATAGIWTIHFGLDNDMWASEYRMRDLIEDAELDIIGLLESDTQRIIMGNRDLTQRIAEELGYYADFGPGPNKHTWGAALLSKFPILNSTHHLLPSPVGELAPAIHATLDMYGTLVDVVVFHSGQEEDEEDRRLQSLYLQELMGSSDKPMILLSYLVTKPLEGNYNTYVSEESGMYDIDPSDDDRWCEYILYKKLKRTGYARISRSSITDTELQVGKFVIPTDDDVFEDYSNDQIPEIWVSKDKRFPEKFYGDGIRDHRYHVFEEPRYFA